MGRSTTSPSSQGEPAPAIPRRRVFGKVVDRRGRPIQGAVVRFDAQGFDYRVPLGPHEVLTVRTNAKGRFHAQLIDGWPYSAMAWFRPQPNSWVRTTVHPCVLGGSSLVLRQADMAYAFSECGIVLEEVEAFAKQMPLRVREFDGGEWRTLTKDRGQWVLAGRAARVHRVQVVADDGKVLVETEVVSPKFYPGQRSDQRAIVRIGLHSRRKRRCLASLLVRDDTGKPVADAQILVVSEDREHETELTRTDARGIAVFGLTLTKNRAQRDVFVRAKGFGDAHVRMHLPNPFRRINEAELRKRSHDVAVRLDRGDVVRGRILDVAGKPAATVAVLFETGSPRFLDSDTPPRIYRTGNDGRFVLPAVGSKACVSIGVWLDAGARRALRGRAPAPLHPIVCVFDGSVDDLPKTNDLGDIRLAELRCVRVSIEHADATALQSPQLRIDATEQHNVRPRVALGRQGLALLPALPGTQLRLIATSSGGLGSATVTTNGTHGTTTPLHITLPATCEVHGRVVQSRFVAPRSLLAFRRLAPSGAGIRPVLARIAEDGTFVVRLCRAARYVWVNTKQAGDIEVPDAPTMRFEIDR